MNKEQFELFLRAQQAQQEQITQILTLLVQTMHKKDTKTKSSTSVSSSSVTSSDKMMVIKNFNMDKYNPDSCRIEDFLDFFTNKCQIMNVTEPNLRKDILLNTLTPEIFRELKIALTPNFDTSTYNDICLKLLDLFRVKKTKYRALTEFWNCTRESSESMEQYANRLKSLSRDCGYKDEMLERQLRDRFATGLNHTDLETDLKQKWPDLQESGREVTFREFFSVAQSREQAELDTPGTRASIT